MKDWDPKHPKAKLMAQKRAVILAAARESFLRYGYEGTSMESIAALSGISIMTLYRHAANKDDLFSTVVLVACTEEEKSELMSLTTQPLGENLVAAAMVIQQKLADPQTVALLRAVIGEVTRFPHLADMTYKSLVGHFKSMVEQLLSDHHESRGLGSVRQKELSVAFVNQLVGVDVFRALLCLPGASQGDQRSRAEAARDSVLAAMGSPAL
jgi:TetR/AcrR family transcriptional repressor of mexJK operon